MTLRSCSRCRGGTILRDGSCINCGHQFIPPEELAVAQHLAATEPEERMIPLDRPDGSLAERRRKQIQRKRAYRAARDAARREALPPRVLSDRPALECERQLRANSSSCVVRLRARDRNGLSSEHIILCGPCAAQIKREAIGATG